MLWRRFTTAVLLLELLSIVSLGQQSSEAAPKLIHRYELSCGYSCAQEVAADIGGLYAGKPEDRVAVRFCSKEPMPLALTTSAAAYGYVISILEKSYGYTPDRVLFLRSGDCLGPNAGVTATEFWAIPKGASMPAAVESIGSSEVRSESFPEKNKRAIGTRNYRAATQQLVKRLRTAPQLVGIVMGYYYDKPSQLMKRRLREIRRALEKSGVQPERYFVRLSPWSGERSIDPRRHEPVYPSFFVVEVAKGEEQK